MKISKFLIMVLISVAMFMTSGNLSFSNISGVCFYACAFSGNDEVVYV